MDLDSLLLPLVRTWGLLLPARVSASWLTSTLTSRPARSLARKRSRTLSGALVRPRPCGLYRHLLFRPKTVRTIHDHLGAGLESAIQNRRLPFSKRHLYGLHLRNLLAARIGFHKPHKQRSVKPRLNRRRRHHQRVLPVLKHQVDIHELVREQDLILVVKHRLQLARARRRIDLVVSGQQHS